MFDPFEYLSNKKILLIGNADLKTEPNYSEYDCIIRLNLGILDKPCDVWINNLVNQAHQFLYDKLGYYPEFKNIIRLNAEKGGKRMERMPDLYKPHAWLWNLEEYTKMQHDLDYHRPTTGLVSVYWILNNIKCDLNVTGYNFFETCNKYTREIHQLTKTFAYPSHEMEKDEYWIKRWHDEGKLNFIEI